MSGVTVPSGADQRPDRWGRAGPQGPRAHRREDRRPRACVDPAAPSPRSSARRVRRREYPPLDVHQPDLVTGPPGEDGLTLGDRDREHVGQCRAHAGSGDRRQFLDGRLHAAGGDGDRRCTHIAGHAHLRPDVGRVGVAQSLKGDRPRVDAERLGRSSARPCDAPTASSPATPARRAQGSGARRGGSNRAGSGRLPATPRRRSPIGSGQVGARQATRRGERPHAPARGLTMRSQMPPKS